jgi:hypothetical protein
MHIHDILYVIMHMILSLIPMGELAALLIHIVLFLYYLLVHLFSR